MKALKKDLQSVVKNIKALTKQTEKLAKKLDKLEKAQVAKKPRATGKRKVEVPKKKVVGRTREVTAMDMVMGIIQKSKRGVNTTQIKTKTGFDDKKIWNAINRLKNQGKIKSQRKGVYVVQ